MTVKRPVSPVQTFDPASVVRGVIIAYGIGAYALISHKLGTTAGSDAGSFGESALYLIVIGLGLQVIRWLVMRAVGRYEKSRGLEGALSPTAAQAIDLLIDGVTVLLFAVATFRGIGGAGAY